MASWVTLREACLQPLWAALNGRCLPDGLVLRYQRWECHRTVDYGILGCLLTARTRLRILLHTVAKHLEAATVRDLRGSFGMVQMIGLIESGGRSRTTQEWGAASLELETVARISSLQDTLQLTVCRRPDCRFRASCLDRKQRQDQSSGPVQKQRKGRPPLPCLRNAARGQRHAYCLLDQASHNNPG